MIRFEHVGVRYPGAARPTLSDVDLFVPEGELCLVVGPTGSGKTTLLSAVNGLVPHFTGGLLTGRVSVAGRDTRTHRPRDLADVVGVVGQDPLSTFVTDTVEEELAYGMESLGLPPPVMRRRVEETLDLLGLSELRGRTLSTLSGGQQQRVAIGAVLAAHPRVLVLDEPTSALDPLAAEEVLAAVERLVADLGVTVLLAEHRLERVVHYADRVVLVPGGGRPLRVGTPAEVMRTSPVAPPIVELGRLAGWDPLPLSVRDARRVAGPLRERLAGLAGPPGAARPAPARPVPAGAAGRDGRPLATVRGLVADYPARSGRRRRSAPPPRSAPAGGAGRRPALRGVDLTVRPGEVVAVMGRNGAGKSTLLRALVGLVRPAAGAVSVGGLTPTAARPAELVRAVGLVPQDPGDILYADTVAGECRQADADFAARPGSCARRLAALAPGIGPTAHPRDLSEGQRLALALAVVLTGTPPLVLLDEPTRGLDYAAKRRLAGALRDLAGRGHAVVLATHDVELVAELATRVVVLADGEVVSDGPTADVVVASPTFAPQVAKVLHPLPWLSVAAVSAGLERAS